MFETRKARFLPRKKCPPRTEPKPNPLPSPSAPEERQVPDVPDQGGRVYSRRTIDETIQEGKKAKHDRIDREKHIRDHQPPPWGDD